MFTEKDLNQISSKGITPEQVQQQIELIKKGFPYLSMKSSASIEKGILTLSSEEQELFLNKWDNYLKSNYNIVKFVPASGAASRMFKDLYGFLEADYETPQKDSEKVFFKDIEKFAFFYALDSVCKEKDGKGITELMKDGQYKKLVDYLLNPKGLNYGQSPKGLIEFHFYRKGPRTAMEEHLVEGALYTCDASRKINIHFTVSPEHRANFELLVSNCLNYYQNEYEVEYNISFSEQKSSTDTIAADANNQAFRDSDGRLVFRPGGHGALIENLNDIDADLVFIKNIDNVVPDHLKEPTTIYKKLIGGILVEYQQKAFDYLKLIDSGKYTHEDLLDILSFLQNDLCVESPKAKQLEDKELVIYLKSKLNRPMRVCGMVRNQGEPGGGPFLTVNSDGTISPQILESSQIDLSKPEMKKLFEEGTHFNPVDLICGVRNYKGEKFNLPEYVDKNTGFISIKSKNGKELKALELPGLWNGAMSDWNTIFVEVPIETFNPVKTVNDLLRPEHQ